VGCAAQDRRAVIRWHEVQGGVVVRTKELTPEVAATRMFQEAMSFMADAQQMGREDVRSFIGEAKNSIATMASAGVLPLDRASWMLDLLRGGTGTLATGANQMAQAPVVIHVEPTPVTVRNDVKTPEVHIANHVDASPKGNIAFEYEPPAKGGRLVGLKRTPAEAGA
jgi:hypothetical protein